tara:strand:+ start:684 stop:1067 length:384 start_codon:yes stop_codon:yes gene_type:complete
MKKLKRDPVKYIRDRAKSKYKKDNECYICGQTSQLDFHHFYTLSPLLAKWLKVKVQERPSHYTHEYITIWRDEFIEDNWAELYDDTVTICHTHHLELHSIYGRNPGLGTAQKQMRWVELQREKHGMV